MDGTANTPSIRAALDALHGSADSVKPEQVVVTLDEARKAMIGLNVSGIRLSLAASVHVMTVTDYLDQQVSVMAGTITDTLRTENAKLRKALSDHLSDQISRDIGIIVTVAIQ